MKILYGQSQDDLAAAKETIKQLNFQISTLDDEVASLTSSLSTLQMQYDTLQQQYNNLHEMYVQEVEDYDHLLVQYDDLKRQAELPMQTSALYQVAYPFTTAPYKPEDATAWLSAERVDSLVYWYFSNSTRPPTERYVWGFDYQQLDIDFLTMFKVTHLQLKSEQHTVTTTAAEADIDLSWVDLYDETTSSYCYIPIKADPYYNNVQALKCTFGLTQDGERVKVELEEFNNNTFEYYRVNTTIV